MTTKRQQVEKRVKKHPDNLRIKAVLEPGDRAIIAEYSKMREGTIREMLNGNRRMTDAVKQAIIRLIEERRQLDETLNEIINN